MEEKLLLHCADWVCPVTSPPIRFGAVLVKGDTIVDIGHSSRLCVQYGHILVHKWSGILVPGLVNAHTHLEFTSLDAVGKKKYSDFTVWTQELLDERRNLTNPDWRSACMEGVKLSIRAGTTCIANVVSNWTECSSVLFDLGIPGISFLEVLGTSKERWLGQKRDQLLGALEKTPVSRVSLVGIAPHAPYSVDRDVLTSCTSISKQMNVRLHLHVGEVESECSFYVNGTGLLADRLRKVYQSRRDRLGPDGWVRTLSDVATGLKTAEFVQKTGLLEGNVHFAHGCYLDRGDFASFASANVRVALCPRSNTVVGSKLPPVSHLLKDNIPFCIGTDSLASSPSLDLLEDLKVLHDEAESAGYLESDLCTRLLQAVTMEGAIALGLDEQLGSLETGKRADFAVIDVDESEDPIAAVVRCGGNRCVGTVVGGSIQYCEGEKTFNKKNKFKLQL